MITLPNLSSNSGGLEILFANKKKHNLKVPTTTSSADKSTTSPRTIQFLVDYLCETVMTDARKELFVLDGTV
jgi:ubiquitin related modifier 1